VNETFEKHRTLSQVRAPAGAFGLQQQLLAGFAALAYFHDREIMVTSPASLQEIFIHMKEAA
jgi:hypothetical protein